MVDEQQHSLPAIGRKVPVEREPLGFGRDFPALDVVDHRPQVAEHFDEQRLGKRSQNRGVAAEVNHQSAVGTFGDRHFQHHSANAGHALLRRHRDRCFCPKASHCRRAWLESLPAAPHLAGRTRSRSGSFRRRSGLPSDTAKRPALYACLLRGASAKPSADWPGPSRPVASLRVARSTNRRRARRQATRPHCRSTPSCAERPRRPTSRSLKSAMANSHNGFM